MSDIDERAVDLVIQSSEISANVIIQALKDSQRKVGYIYKDIRKEQKYQKRKKKNAPKTGKQKLDELNQHGRQTAFVPIDDKQDLLELQKELKRYSIDFSIVKEGNETYHVFFKTQDTERFNLALEKVIQDFDKKNAEKLTTESKEVDPEEKKEVAVDDKQVTDSKNEVKDVNDRADKVNLSKVETAKEINLEKEAADPGFKDYSGIEVRGDKKKQLEKSPTVRTRLEKAKKEASEFNKAVKKEQALNKNKAPKNKGGPEK